MRCRMTCLAVWAAMRPKLSGRHLVTLDLGLVDRRQVDADLVTLFVANLESLDVDVLGKISWKTRMSPVSGSISTLAVSTASGVLR